ncbi:MAG: tetratricopeptide repeat protein [Candidatus Dormibacteraeota bacterium]|nr:tetratricopeptide repeat protein [Candidatus Dormibacteraeota bacterium]
MTLSALDAVPNANPLDHAARLLRSRAGLKAEPASRARLERLLQESAELAGVPVQYYVDMVDTEPAAFDDLLDRVTVQHSAFFRDPTQFVALAELGRDAGSSPQTVWSAGCGNGQEPYSLAMLLDETGRRNWHVVATDVSFRALARTEKAQYTEREVQGLSIERRKRYLVKDADGGYEIAPFLRRSVRIAHHNLAHEAANSVVPQSTVVFCRNVLMYFGQEESERCIRRIADRIAPGGHLFLGHSDSPGRMTAYFETCRVAGAFCYRRLSAPVPAPPAPWKRQDPRPPADLPGLLLEGDAAAASGDLRAAVRAFRQATYLDPNLAIAYFQLGAALELAGDRREARRAFGAAGLAMMRGDGSEDLSALGGYSRRDLARAIASKLTMEPT